MNACEELKQLYQGLPKLPHDMDLQKFLDQGDFSLPKVVLKRTALFELYKDNVRNLLIDCFGKWNPTLKTARDREEFFKAIEFDDSGRVIFDRNVAIVRAGYFPSVIKELTGTLIVEGQVESIDFLERVGELEIKGDKLQSMRRLKKVDGDVKISSSPVKNLDGLQEVGGRFYIFGADELNSLPSLRVVKGKLEVELSRIKDFSSLEEAGALEFVNNSRPAFFDSLRRVNGECIVRNAKVEAFPALSWVAGSFKAQEVEELSDLSNLEVVEGSLIISGTKIRGLPRLKEVAERFVASSSCLKQTPLLQTVGGNFSVNYSLFESAPLLRKIGGILEIDNSMVVDFSTAFPHLSQIGESPLLYSVCTSSPSIMVEVQALKEKGKLDFSGDIKIIKD
jgi:hypothetical protein